MESNETKVKLPVKRLAGQLAGEVVGKQKHNIFGTCSKDKLNGKVACTMHRNKNCKLPRIVRVQSKSNVIKSAGRMGGKLDETGDKPGPSKVPGTLSRKNIAPEKLKPSHIPRRKTSFKETCNKEHSTKKDCQFLGDSRNSRNVQRIQLLINQDFRPEDRVPASSIASTRPIPTLGQIYTRNNVIDADRLDNWFVELDTPANSIASNFFNISSRLVNVRANAENDIVANKYNAMAVTNMEFDSTTLKQNAYRTADENISDWLSTDVEYPTRDNESGYRSLSPPTHIPMDVKSKQSKCSFVSRQDEDEKNDRQLSRSSSKDMEHECLTKEVTAATLKAQSTVVLTQPTQASVKRETDQSKNYQYPSRSNCAPLAKSSQAQVTVPSYVECPSEILQKTTNFEDMIPVPCDSPNRISSSIGGGAELDFHDDLSSQYTLEQGECCMHDHCTMEWCHQCRSCGRDEKSNISEDTSVADSLICQYTDSLLNSSDDQFVHHCRWKRHYQGKRHCKKCQRYRRFPSTRYKLPKPLSMLRRRMSLRMCRRRLSRVWKKTTERWAMWSAKSPHKFRKLRMMHYLQRSILWEDADVQTNVFIYRETGTVPTLKELKSAGVSAIGKVGTNLTCSNIAPENKSRSQEKFQEKSNSVGKENDIDNPKPTKKMNHEAQKRENHVITQTAGCFYSKDKNELKNKYDVAGIPEYKSENCIEICEVSMDDKHTGTEDMLSPMQDNVTCTELDLDNTIFAIQPNKIWEAQNANTQMQILCNNAETDVTFPSMKEYQAESVLTSMSNDDVFYTPCGTNTDLKNLRSINMMTSRELLKCSPTFSHIETQITPVQSLQKISTGILTAKSLLERNSEKVDTSTEMSDIENSLKDFSNQVTPHRPSFQCTVTKSTSTTTATVNEAYSVTSKKELRCTEVLTCEAQIKSGSYLPSPPQQQCRCPIVESSSRGTETNDSYSNTSPLTTYFNTGMLINTLVEGALKYSDEKTSVKDRYPKRLSVDTNSYLNHTSRSTISGTGKKSSNLSQKKTNHSTQYSYEYIAQKDATPSYRLLSVQTLNPSADDSAAQTDPVRIDGLSVPQQYKCTSVFTSQCALDQPVLPITSLPKDFGHMEILPSSSPLVNRRKSDSCRNSSFQLNTSAVISSNLDADKWIKSYVEKGYQGHIEMEQSSDENKQLSVFDSCGYKSSDDKKSDSKSVGSETESENQRMANNVATIASAVTDMALEKYNETPTKDTNEKQIVKMVDDVTSADEVLRKQVKEITLQASPESCEAATEYSQAIEKKSVSVFTSRCILPLPSPCCCQIQNCGSFTGDCVFVYGKPRCVMHSNQEFNDASASVQMSFSRTQTHAELCPHSNQIPSDLTQWLRSVGMVTPCYGASLSCQKQNKKMAKTVTPKVCKAQFETTKRSGKGPRHTAMKSFCKFCNSNETEANLLNTFDTRSASMLASPVMRSATVITSLSRSVPRSDQFTQRDSITGFPRPNNFSFLHVNTKEGGVQTSCENQHARLLEVPTHDDNPDCEVMKSQLVTSCRYYSTLLTEQLGRIRENLTRHLSPCKNTKYQGSYQIPSFYTEACTMKPSAREEFGCQTFQIRSCYKGSKYTTALTPAISLIDIRQHDKEHLKSVYYMLTAIEGPN